MADAWAHCLKLLSMRGRSRLELERALKKHGVEGGEAQALLERLAKLGYVDDDRFAKDRALFLLGQRRLGPEGVRQRLLALGLVPDLVEKGLRWAEEELGFDVDGVAAGVLAKQGLSGTPLGMRERARAARLLASRGFSEEVVERVVGQPGLDSGAPDD